MRAALPVLLVGSLAATSAFAAPVLSENFDSFTPGATTNTTFTESIVGTTANMTIEADAPSGNDYQAAISSTGSASVSAGLSTTALSLANLGTNSFSISTEFTLDAFTGPGGSTMNFGLAAFGSDVNFSSGSQYRLLFSPVAAAAVAVNRLSLQESGGSGTLTTAVFSTGTLTSAPGVTGTLTLNGSYNASGHLVLNGTLVSGTTTLTVDGTDTTPLTGTNFGYRTAVSTTTGTVSENVDYDNFAIDVVPEPMSAALFAGGLGLLALRRRR